MPSPGEGSQGAFGLRRQGAFRRRREGLYSGAYQGIEQWILVREHIPYVRMRSRCAAFFDWPAVDPRPANSNDQNCCGRFVLSGSNFDADAKCTDAYETHPSNTRDVLGRHPSFDPAVHGTSIRTSTTRGVGGWPKPSLISMSRWARC